MLIYRSLDGDSQRACGSQRRKKEKERETPSTRRIYIFMNILPMFIKKKKEKKIRRVIYF